MGDLNDESLMSRLRDYPHSFTKKELIEILLKILEEPKPPRYY